MDGACYQILADAGLTAQEHRHIRLGHLFDRGRGGLHGRAVAHEAAEGGFFFEAVVELAVFDDEFEAIECAGDYEAQMV